MPDRAPARGGLLTVFALLVLVWQSLVIQTHVHPSAGHTSAAMARTSWFGAEARRDAAPISALDCAACRQLAQSADLLAGTPISLPAHARYVLVSAFARSQRWCLRRAHLGWQSRAPPVAR